MSMRYIMFVFLSYIFCCGAFADTECPVGYWYKINQESGFGGCVDLGTLNWRKDQRGSIFYTLDITDRKISRNDNVGYCAIYDVARSWVLVDNFVDKTIYQHPTAPNLYIRDDRYSDTDAFKQAMSGIIFYYQRTTDSTWIPPRDGTVCNIDTSSYEPYGEYVLPAMGECTLCPPNTYKDFVGNEACTPCPNGLLSVAGATSIDQCGHLLHTGNYIAFMPVGKRTEHGLCTMFDGKKYCTDMYEKQ